MLAPASFVIELAYQADAEARCVTLNGSIESRNRRDL